MEAGDGARQEQGPDRGQGGGFRLEQGPDGVQGMWGQMGAGTRWGAEGGPDGNRGQVGQGQDSYLIPYSPIWYHILPIWYPIPYLVPIPPI